MLSIGRTLRLSELSTRYIMKRTRTIKYDLKEPSIKRSANYPAHLIETSRKDAKEIAVKKLKNGEVIAIPTDTVYGLTCSANNPKAIRQLYRIKERNELKPIAICVATIEKFRCWGVADHLSDELLKELLPGPVTVVVKRSPKLIRELNPDEPNIGIRITENSFIQEVCKAFGEPIALTSANKSSSKSTLKVTEFEELWPELGAVFNGGQLGLSEAQRAASTVIDLSVPEYYTIIRRGVSVEEIIKIVEKYNIRLRV